MVTEKDIDASELVPPKGKAARCSIVEDSEAMRGRYFRAPKKAKTEILNEFVATTSMHRKAVTGYSVREADLQAAKNTGRHSGEAYKVCDTAQTTY
jgi:hypothetical protein